MWQSGYTSHGRALPFDLSTVRCKKCQHSAGGFSCDSHVVQFAVSQPSANSKGKARSDAESLRQFWDMKWMNNWWQFSDSVSCSAYRWKCWASFQKMEKQILQSLTFKAVKNLIKWLWCDLGLGNWCIRVFFNWCQTADLLLKVIVWVTLSHCGVNTRVTTVTQCDSRRQNHLHYLFGVCRSCQQKCWGKLL